MHFYFVLGAFAFFMLVFFLYSPTLIFGFWQKVQVPLALKGTVQQDLRGVKMVSIDRSHFKLRTLRSRF
jgi:hypothetical protein